MCLFGLSKSRPLYDVYKFIAGHLTIHPPQDAGRTAPMPADGHQNLQGLKNGSASVLSSQILREVPAASENSNESCPGRFNTAYEVRPQCGESGHSLPESNLAANKQNEAGQETCLDNINSGHPSHPRDHNAQVANGDGAPPGVDRLHILKERKDAAARDVKQYIDRW